MVKREFIEKKKAENITWQEPYYHDPINVCSEIRDKIRELPTITEQDIVKPYLIKVREETEKLKQHANCTFDRLNALDDVIQFIDSLLSEQGDTE